MSESSTTSSDFADRLREARERREMTQADLARATGLIPSAIAHFEAGRRKPSFDNIRILAKALGVTSDTLMGDCQATTAFRNEERLSNKNREYIQSLIDIMVKEKKE